MNTSDLKEQEIIRRNSLKQLIEMGINLYEELSQFPEDIVGGQHFHGEENVELARTYDEVNYIKQDILRDWVTRVDEMERFEPIKDEVRQHYDLLD